MAKKPELLAPVGNFQMLAAAVNAGADAVYFGLQEFTMRAGARNFKINELDSIRRICKPNKVKMYLTLNTIIYDNELKKIEKIVKKVKGKVDAIICWDLSVINLCRKYGIPFHISTQASVANTNAAKFYKRLGAERIILARELSLDKIKKIAKIIDVEVFIHGAMCVSVSGRCFTSQFLFGKSANRGECLHPCRRMYTVKDDQGEEMRVNNNYIFSAKDLCALPFIEKLKKAGIVSFKIEGRNREARYVDTVVKVYRKALDKKLTKNEIRQGVEELKRVYNKGFSSGFYFGVPDKNGFSPVEHSSSQEKKHFIGKITKYYPKLKVATIQLVSSVKVGDEIVVIGKTTGVLNDQIDSIEIKKKQVKSGKKGQEIGIKVCDRVRKNDEVYKIIKKKGVI